MDRKKLERMENRIYSSTINSEYTACTNWSRLFSEDELQSLDRFYQGKMFKHLRGTAYEIEKWTWWEAFGEAEQFWEKTFRQDEREETIPCACFPGFYQRLYGFARNVLCASTEEMRKEDITLLWESLFPDLEMQYSSCSLRILVREMHGIKAKGLLSAADSQKEYARFEQEYVNQLPYFLELFHRYPVMWRSVVEKTVHLVNSRTEAWRNHEKDRELIAERFGIGKDIRLISIQGGQSDLHLSARSVLTFVYENGRRIVYKPRSLENELFFQKNLRWFSKGTGILQHCYKILDCTSYGWEEWISAEECQTEKGVESFYKRAGQLLFLAYLFSINDLHQENILAAGEFPIIIDLETFLHSRKMTFEKDADSQAKNRIRDSVLSTGFLPFYTGHGEGNAVVLSALGDAAPQRSWVKVPVIECAGTSDMHVEYRHTFIRQAGNIPTLKEYVRMLQLIKKVLCRGLPAPTNSLWKIGEN